MSMTALPHRSHVVSKPPRVVHAYAVRCGSRKVSAGFTEFGLFSLRLLYKNFTPQSQPKMERAHHNTPHSAEFTVPRTEL